MALLKATKRQDLGTRKVRLLRKQGLIPGVIYGHGETSQPITLSEHDVELAILHGERVLEIDVDGQEQNVLIKDVQYDTFGQEVLHVDLARVALDERVEVTVPVVLKGTPTGVTEGGGVLQQIAAEARIECAVQAIPEQIDVLVTEMKVGDTLTMADLSLPEGAELLDDSAAPVANIRVVVEAEAAPAEEAAAGEPEVIGGKPGEQGEADEGESSADG